MRETGGWGCLSFFADADSVLPCRGCGASAHPANPLIVMQARYAERWQKKEYRHEIALCLQCFDLMARNAHEKAVSLKGAK